MMRSMQNPTTAGYRLIVAIADVAHYVRPDAPLDDAARTRGNSCYFPDRVVPMLPEQLSNGWCSLRPDEERGCLFVDMRIDATGRKLSHTFGRGLMKSAARLTYTQVQDAHDTNDTLGLPPGCCPPSTPPSAPCSPRATPAARSTSTCPNAASFSTTQARSAKSPPARAWTATASSRNSWCWPTSPRPRNSNACAAPACTACTPRHPTKSSPICAPSSARWTSPCPAGRDLHPRDLDAVLKKVAGSDRAQMVNEVMLRSQSQAAYHPDNIGHFGLSLARYAHFTSPIRRYADLLVHRALIAGLKLGLGPLTPEETAAFEDTAEHITATERRAALAERDAVDRYLSAYMADKVGATFPARISGVTRFGLFVTIEGSGANGLIPLSSLPDDYWMHDEATQTLNGRHSRQSFRLSQPVSARLREAAPITGGLVFELISENDASTGSRQGARSQIERVAERGRDGGSPIQSGAQGRSGRREKARQAVRLGLAIVLVAVAVLAVALPACVASSRAAQARAMPRAAGSSRAPDTAAARTRLFDVDLQARVFGTALAFAAPRILDPSTPAELATWGLDGITALDPSLSVDRHGRCRAPARRRPRADDRRGPAAR